MASTISQVLKIARAFENQLEERVPQGLRETAKLRLFGLLKIPVLFFISPSVRELNGDRCVVRIPLNRRTRNHLKSMYFGVLACGADCAGGLLAMHHIEEQAPGQVTLIFKDFQAKFLKRPEGDTDFVCEDGAAIAETVRKAIETGERQNFPMKITAQTVGAPGSEPAAEFVLTLSLKYRKSGASV